MKPWRHTFLTNGLIFASGLASGIIAARLLGPEDRGHLAAVIYWPHFVAGVAAMGINEAITIRTAKTGATESIRSTTLALSLGLALLAVAVALPLLPWLLGSSRQESVPFTQIYFAIFVPLSFIAMNFLAVEQGQFNYRRFNFQRIVQALAYPVLLVAFWLAGALTVQTAAIAVLAGTAIVALTRLWQGRAELKATPSLSEARELVVQGVRLHATNLAMFLAMQVDKMALVLFASDLQLGFYVVATTAASATQSLLVQTYNNVMLPAAAKSGSDEKSLAAIVDTLRKLIALLLLATLLMVVLLPFFLPLVFGDDFSDAVPYAQVLVVAFAFVGLKSALIYLFRAWAVNRPGIAAEGLASVVLLVGAYPVLEQWGSLGLATLVLAAHVLGAFLLLAWFMRHTKSGVRQLLAR